MARADNDTCDPATSVGATATLAGLGALPTAALRTVPVDPRRDWAAPAREAGFEIGPPAAWIAEGLLQFLPPDAQDRLRDKRPRKRRPA